MAARPLDALQELIAVVDRLRDPESGCPWDLEQTHSSLIPYVLEEAHEVADAIRRGNDAHLAEELGDLLLQVLLHARIAAEEQRFDLEAVARSLTAKLVRRHPHVFGDEQAAGRGRGGDSAAVVELWRAIKAEEKAAAAAAAAATAGPPSSTASAAAASGATAASASAAASGASASGAATAAGADGSTTATTAAASAAASPSASPLSDALTEKVRSQPALAGAMLISKRAAAAGFEWDDLEGVWEKVNEEMEELREAVASGDRSHAQEELGDVLFTLVNVARWCALDPEEALAGTNRRFLDRFSRVEAALGGDLQGRTIRELEGHWREAKARIRAEAAPDRPAAQDAAD